MPEIIRTMYVLAVPNVTDTARYFQDALGFELLPIEDEGWRFLRRDVCRVMIGECPGALHPSALGGHNYFGYFVVDDIDTPAAEYEAKGVRFRQSSPTSLGACASSKSFFPMVTYPTIPTPIFSRRRCAHRTARDWRTNGR